MSEYAWMDRDATEIFTLNLDAYEDPDYEDDDDDKLPQGNGIYVLSAANGTRWEYPLDYSSVYYIGKQSGTQRIRRHVSRALQAARFLDQIRNNGQYQGNAPLSRHAFAAEFGIHVHWYAVRSDTADAEARILRRFVLGHGSIPICNNRSESR